MKEYPNLPLLEYKCRVYITSISCGVDIRRLEFDATVFSQVWASTALGFPGVGGSAMTEAYTTIIEERMTNTFFVFFGGDLCYRITDPNETFFEDMKNCNMTKQANAIGRYKK